MQQTSFWERGFGRQFFSKQRLTPLLFLAATLAASNVLAYAVAASLFLTKVGTEAIPLFYVWLGVLSVPVSAVFARIIDRYSRLEIFRYFLLGAGALICLLWALIGLNTVPVYYALYISFSLFDLLFYILLWTLVSDYFTPLELERVTANVAMAMTCGGMVSGGCVRFLSDRMTSENLLLGVPLLYAVAIAQLFSFQESKQRLVEPVKNQLPLLDSLKTSPQILSRYPIIWLLAANMVVSVVLWTISELQFFRIYSQTFPHSEDLTGFLGLLSAWFSVLELGVTYFFTRPLIQQWGVSRMNLVYPVTTLASFLLLTIVQTPYFSTLQLPAAIIANLNYEPLNNSVAEPIHSLNYNAIPYQFGGRVRVMINGLFYPACQALTGGLLLVPAAQNSSFKLALVGIVLSGIMVSIGYLTGKKYLWSVLIQLQLGVLKLEEVSEGLVQLPAQYVRGVRQMLKSDNPQTQCLGVELAARFTDPTQFLDEVQTLLLRADATVRHAVAKLLSSSNHPDFIRFLRTQIVSDSDAVRAVVLEAFIASDQPLSNVQLCFFLEDSNPEIRALACVAVWQAMPELSTGRRAKKKHRRQEDGETGRRGDKEKYSPHASRLTPHASPITNYPASVQAAYSKVWENDMDAACRLVIIRAISRIENRQLIPLLQVVLNDTTSEEQGVGYEENALPKLSPAEIAVVKEEGLQTLAKLARRGDESLAALGAVEFAHSDARVRAAALNLLGVVRSEKMFALVVKGLADPEPVVRQAAARAIALYEEFHP